NDFAVRISGDEWKRLNEDPEKPLLNRAIQAQLAPGSVFKIVTATAMLEDHVPSESFKTTCPGYATFFGRQYHRWVYYAKTGGIASRGVFMQPHMLKDAPNVGVERFPISEPTAEKITDAMYGVVNEPGGTAGQLRLAGIELSGKSGTAQVIGYDTLARIHKQK